jgi:enoyl-CoA hydratase/carnithine racemase
VSQPEQAGAEEPELVVDRRGAGMILRLNRPQARNSLTPSLMAGLGHELLAAEADPQIRAIVLTGTGDRAFCAGLDLRSFAAGEENDANDANVQAFSRLILGEAKMPVIGAANATAVAGGLELLLGCDLIVLAEGARIGLPEVKRGLFPGGGGVFIGQRIPLAIALELTLTGDTIDAARGAALGLVNAVVPADQVLDTALDYAQRIAANGPLALAAIKELVRLAVFDGTAAKARQRELQPVIWASEDAREGAIAFAERREPVWKGR